MKRLVFFIASVLISLVSFADPIPLTLGGGPPPEYGGNGHRVPALLPTADYEDNVVNVYVPYDIEDMQVIIRDVEGEVIYSALIPYVSVQHSIVLSDDESGDKYSIELFFNGWRLIGYF